MDVGITSSFSNLTCRYNSYSRKSCNTYSCSWSHKKTFNGEGWHGWIERDDEGYLIIDGIKICKSLTYGKEMVFFGVQSQKKIVSEVALNINRERTEFDIEYLKAPKR